MNKTRKNLLTSALSLLLCFALLVGTTFAWFTDSVTSSKNIIQAGTLDVVLEYYDGTEWKDVKESSEIFDAEALWEPGYVQTAYLRMKNTGTLAFDYDLSMNIVSETEGTNVAGESFLLSDYIYFDVVEGVNGETAPYASRTEALADTTETNKISGGYTESEVLKADTDYKYYGLVVYMPTTVGNEANYRGTTVPTIEFGIKVTATQATVESDSFDDQYDVDASFDIAKDLGVELDASGNEVYVARSVDGLVSAAKLSAAETIESVVLSTNEGDVVVPVVSDDTELLTAVNSGNEYVVLSAGSYTMPTSVDLRSDTLVIAGSDAVIDASGVDARNQYFTGADLTFAGVTLNFGKVNYMGFANCTSILYKDCDINGLQFLFGPSVVFDNCNLDSNGAEHTVWTYGVVNVEFNDCDFVYGDRAVNCYSDNDVTGGKQTVNFNNCTFTTANTASEGAVEINSCFFSVGIEVNLDGCTAPQYGELAFVSQWDSTQGAKTTINIK